MFIFQFKLTQCYSVLSFTFENHYVVFLHPIPQKTFELNFSTFGII